MRHKSFKFIILSIFVLMLVLCVACTRAQQPLGSAGVDLKHWKLQFAGPTDVASAMFVKGFLNQYFHFDPTTKGLTSNSRSFWHFLILFRFSLRRGEGVQVKLTKVKRCLFYRTQRY